jgi:hypothetical protein
MSVVRQVRCEEIIDMGDVVTIKYCFPEYVSYQQADEWMRIKQDVHPEVISRKSRKGRQRKVSRNVCGNDWW